MNSKKKENQKKTLRHVTASLLLNITASLLSMAVISIGVFAWEQLSENIIVSIIVLILLIINIWLLRCFIVSKMSKSASRKYRSYVEPFVTLVDQIEEKVKTFDHESSDAGSVYLLHWVPTFALSRGLNRETMNILPSESPVYTSIRQLLQETRGKVICFDGKGIYRFLKTTNILFGDPLLTASYLEEIIQLFNDTRITYSFLPWGLFPYSLIVLGDHYAVFDFTSISDLRETEGHHRAAKRATLRLETTDKEEVKNVRRNMFTSLQVECVQCEKLKEKTINYLKKIAEHLRKEKVLISPEIAESKYWIDINTPDLSV